MPENESSAGSSGLEGRIIANYQIIKRIGRGGMGEVYLARDVRLDRKVAVKILSPEFVGDAERLERFRREAKIVAALNHPNIVTIFSVEDAEGLRFFTMELVEGRKLHEMIPESGLETGKFLEIAISLAEALAGAHEQGVTHRDLKPANIMVTHSGRVKVLDFGIAKLLPASQSGRDSTQSLTQSGYVLGTTPYMSPEQLQGEPVDYRVYRTLTNTDDATTPEPRSGGPVPRSIGIDVQSVQNSISGTPKREGRWYNKKTAL
jgi:serine/threonine protein kinase